MAQHKEGVLEKATELKDQLAKKFRVKLDDSDQSPGWKFAEYEMKGVPLRIEIGPKDIEKGVCVAVRRDNGEKITHTIDPRTGYSVSSTLLSATVVAHTCAEADAAATMFMALGSEGGAVELAKDCERTLGWKYYFIFADGDGYRVEASTEFIE